MPPTIEAMDIRPKPTKHDIEAARRFNRDTGAKPGDWNYFRPEDLAGLSVQPRNDHLTAPSTVKPGKPASKRGRRR
jgi:hypothetical protein